MTITVTGVRVSGGTAIVTFADGHVVHFTRSPGAPVLESFRLLYGGEDVIVFNSRHQTLVQPHGFVYMAPEYKPRRVADYWRAAHNHVLRASLDEHLLDAWRIVKLGGTDINEIKQGLWFPVPRP